MSGVSIVYIALISAVVLLSQERTAVTAHRGICGDKHRQTPGELTSPYYHGDYPSNVDCSWIISATEKDKVIILSFLTFELENSHNCEYDYLKIYDGDNADSKMLGRFCGNNLPESLTSSDTKLFIVFRSDGGIQKAGFKIKFTESYACDGVYNQDSGEIISPNYPEKHPARIKCSYRITVKSGSKIRLLFQEFKLEQSPVCKYDHLKVFDGPTETSPSLGQFCGDKIPKVWKSTGNEMLIKFVTDNSVEKAGFRLKYYAVGHTTSEICQRPAYTGNCRAAFQRWYYNTATGKCEIFTYGGCNSNGNNFRTMKECEVNCKDTTVNECAKSNGGCDQGCHNTIGSYFCSCWKGYRNGDDGHSCIDVDECSSGREMHHCEQSCVNMPGSYYCTCRSGFRLSANKRTCKDQDECIQRPCQHNCRNTLGSYKCTCFKGFQSAFGSGGTKCMDINECELSPPDCHKCFNLQGSFRCECRSGFILNNNRTRCIDIDECLVNNGGCSQLCINQPGSYFCQCREGYQPLDSANVTCEDIDECSNNSGKGNCQHQCANSVGSFTCSCPTGYRIGENKLNCVDVDECLVDNGGCKDKCINLPSSFKCGCHDGFREIGRNGSDLICQDIDECFTGIHQCDIELGATCVNEIGNYTCICPSGYQLEGRKCVDVDECHDSKINGCSQQCNNTQGSFHCSCFNGFVMNSDNTTCTDIDECASSSCDHECINFIGSYRCLCNNGYYLDKDLKTCLDIDECVFVNGLCDHTCINTNGSFKCECRPGFRPKSDKSRCDDIDECSEGTACCDTLCWNEPGGYKCGCPGGHYLSKNNCTCKDIDECSVNNGGCDHICNNTKGKFSCSCHPGYMIDPTNSSRCLDINECLQENGGCSQICNNTKGSYECQCRPIFKLAPDGKTCDHCPSCESFEELILVVEKLQLEVQSLKNWRASVNVEKDNCRFKSKTYEDGKNWDDGKCRRCFCQKGQILCFQDKKCFEPACPAPSKACSFQPEDTCLADEDCAQGEKCCQQATCRPDKVCLSYGDP